MRETRRSNNFDRGRTPEPHGFAWPTRRFSLRLDQPGTNTIEQYSTLTQDDVETSIRSMSTEGLGPLPYRPVID